MHKRMHTDSRPVTSRVLAGAQALRRRVASAMDRGQLGPSSEREWHQFGPGR